MHTMSFCAKRLKSFWNVPEKPSVSLTFFFRKRFQAAGGTRREAPHSRQSRAKRDSKRKGLEENFVFLFAFFAYAKIRFIVGETRVSPLRKGAWGKTRGVSPKRFWKTKFDKNAHFRRFDAAENAGERVSHKPSLTTTLGRKAGAVTTSLLKGCDCTRAIFRVRCPKNRKRARINQSPSRGTGTLKVRVKPRRTGFGNRQPLSAASPAQFRRFDAAEIACASRKVSQR